MACLKTEIYQKGDEGTHQRFISQGLKFIKISHFSRELSKVEFECFSIDVVKYGKFGIIFLCRSLFSVNMKRNFLQLESFQTRSIPVIYED